MSKKNEIKNFMARKLNYLQAIAEMSEGKGILAELRKGVGKHPGEMPQLFGTVLQDFPEDMMSISGDPTKEEWACYIALTMFAWHQQGHDTNSEYMHTDMPVSFGDALKKLAVILGDSNSEERMMKRLQALLNANEISDVAQHIRSVIKLFSGNGIKLNYAILATDLYEMQIPERKPAISLKWGQDFYKAKDKEN